jgi:hypothetical protein
MMSEDERKVAEGNQIGRSTKGRHADGTERDKIQ